MAFTYYPHDPSINRQYDPVEASYYLYQEYFINQNHWNTHAGQATHGHDFSNPGIMRMSIDLMFLIELYRQLRARSDSRQTDLLNKLVVWLDYFYTGLNSVKNNQGSWYNDPFSGPGTAFAVNCMSQAYNHLPVEAWRTARYKEIADAGANAIANFEIAHYYNGTGKYEGANWYTQGIQEYDCGKYCGDGSQYSKAPYRRHNTIAMNAGALGRHAYHVARISGYPDPMNYPYRSSLVRLAQYIKNIQLTNGGWKQGGLSGGDEGSYYRCSTQTGQQELAVGVRCLAPTHYNMFDIIGLLWAGQGTTYTPQNQIPASMFADSAKLGGDFYTRLVTKTNMFPVYTDGNNNGTWNIVDPNALYRAGVVDYYDFHTSDTEVPSWYTGVAFLGSNYQWLVDQCFKREGFMEMAAHDHNAMDDPKDYTVTGLDRYGDGTKRDLTLEVHDKSKRPTAKWGYQNEPCFHRVLLGLTGCMEKGLTIYG